jgi:hypothetical protein
VVVAVLDGCQGVVDDGLVDLVGLAALVHGCSEAVAELGGYVSGVGDGVTVWVNLPWGSHCRRSV